MAAGPGTLRVTGAGIAAARSGAGVTARNQQIFRMEFRPDLVAEGRLNSVPQDSVIHPVIADPPYRFIVRKPQ